MADRHHRSIYLYKPPRLSATEPVPALADPVAVQRYRYRQHIDDADSYWVTSDRAAAIPG